MDHPLAKHAAVVLSVITAVGGVWARFIVIEERQANQLATIARLSGEVAALRAHVDIEERATRERFYASDLRLGSLEDRCPTTVTVTKRSRR